MLYIYYLLFRHTHTHTREKPKGNTSYSNWLGFCFRAVAEFGLISLFIYIYCFVRSTHPPQNHPPNVPFTPNTNSDPASSSQSAS